MKNKQLSFADLNPKEKKVVRLLARVGVGGLGLNDIARRALGVKKGSSGARNSVRRPKRARMIQRVGRKGSGTYQITTNGRREVRSASR